VLTYNDNVSVLSHIDTSIFVGYIAMMAEITRSPPNQKQDRRKSRLGSLGKFVMPRVNFQFSDHGVLWGAFAKSAFELLEVLADLKEKSILVDKDTTRCQVLDWV
jgi:hypothetical protein